MTRTPRRRNRARELDDLASSVEKLEDTLDVQDVKDVREVSESMYEGLATIRETHAKLREKGDSPLPAFLVSLLSHNFWFARVILERRWPRERKDETKRRVGEPERVALTSTVLDIGLVTLSFTRSIGTNTMLRRTLRVVRWEGRFMCTSSRLSLIRYRLSRS